MITDKYILNKISNIKYKKTDSIFNRLTDEEQQYVKNRYNDSLSIKETFYRIKNNIEIRPVCKNCGKPVEFCRNGYFRDFCCISCINLSNEIKNKRKNNSLNKYGCEFPSQSKEFREKFNNTIINRTPEEKENISKKYREANANISKERKKEIQEKIKKTKLERYGDAYYCNSKKSNETKLERYGKLVNIEKYKKTMLEKYGVEFPLQLKEIKEKTIQTNLKKYGVEFPSQSKEIKEKTIQTNLKKYGVEFPSQSKEIKEKQKTTCLEKYGVETFFKANKLKYKCHSEDANNKRNITLKTNNSFIVSKPEEKCYALLKEKYPDIIRQYRSEVYPFNCDFYIPSINMYIEYQGSQYHHNHPFDKYNIDDINELNRLKELNKKSNRHKEGKKSQYDNIIYVWSDLDVRKRNIAKENNLNYIELWNFDDVKNLVDKNS